LHSKIAGTSKPHTNQVVFQISKNWAS